MSRICKTYVATLTLVALAALPAQAAVRTCRSPASTTIEQSSTVRVFSKSVSGVTRYYGCYKRTGRKTQLSVNDVGSDGNFAFGLTQIAGRYVAFAERSFNSAAEGGTVIDIFNLRTRRLRLESIKTAGAGDPIEWNVTDLVLSSSGSAAWITTNQYNSAISEVWKLTTDGDTQLDSGNIGSTSLTLSGSTLNWTKDGAAQTGTL